MILITAWGSIGLAVAGMKAGASDFITKPWTNEQLLHSVRSVLGVSAARPSPVRCRRAPTARTSTRATTSARSSAQDPRLLRILEIVGRVAPTDASVLVTGESGTGKELIAEAIHRNSRRQRGPFVKVNLGGISSTLFESEMFGHVKGAFTDARSDRKGRFEMAHGGTIFLDEIGDLDLASQVKLLRVLQDRTFEVLGSSLRRTVDVRVVAATNRNLAEKVERGEFREDLLYRINLIAVHLPPLRERRDDIPVLAARFLQTVGEVYRREGLAMSAAAVRWLQGLPWPGNVRQLRQWIERDGAGHVEAIAGGRRLRGHLRDGATGHARGPAADGRQHDAGRDREGDDREVAAAPRRQHQPRRRVARPEPRRALPAPREVRDRDVTLRRWLIAYLVALHLLVAALAVVFLREPRGG